MTKRFLISMVSVAVFAYILAAPSHADAATLNRQLDVGMSGSDVTALQVFLAKDPAVYPEGIVTGYYGTLTQSAVSRFQTHNDLPSVGRVGPMTLPILNAQMEGGVAAGVDVYAPVISGVSLTASANSANISWLTNESARGIVYYSESPLVIYEGPHTVTANGSTALTDLSFRGSQNVALTGLKANTTYYYMVHATDQANNVSVAWPSTFRTNQ